MWWGMRSGRGWCTTEAKRNSSSWIRHRLRQGKAWWGKAIWPNPTRTTSRTRTFDDVIERLFSMRFSDETFSIFFFNCVNKNSESAWTWRFISLYGNREAAAKVDVILEVNQPGHPRRVLIVPLIVQRDLLLARSSNVLIGLGNFLKNNTGKLHVFRF